MSAAAVANTSRASVPLEAAEHERVTEDDDEDEELFAGESSQNQEEEVEEEAADELPSLKIPITSSSSNRDDLFIEIFPEEMSDIPASTLIQVLQDEEASLAVWADAGLLYMQQKRSRESSTLLQAACDRSGDSSSGNNSQDRDERARILASTGICQLANNMQDQADMRFTQAAKVQTIFPMTWMGRGMLNLRIGRLDQARFFFDTTLKQKGDILPALLGMAAVLYGEKNFRGAQDMYAKALRLYPHNSGAATRVGFGLACYRLGQVDRAKAAFARALELDRENVPAMVGAALLDLAGLDGTYSKEFAARTEKAIKMMSMANLLDNSNAMVQNHLANHYFWKWSAVPGSTTVSVQQHSKTIQLKHSQQTTSVVAVDPGDYIRIGTDFETIVVSVEEEDKANNNDNNNNKDASTTTIRIKDVWTGPSMEGIKLWKKDYDRVVALAKGAYGCTSVQEIQAESLFLLGRVYHVKEDLENAHKFYERACKLSPALAPARFGLAQTYMAQEDYDQAAKELQLVLKTSSTATDALAALGLLYVKKGGKEKYQEGLSCIRKAIDLDPLNPDLIVLEALALQEHEANYGKALDRYKKAVQLMERKQQQQQQLNHPHKKRIPFEIYTNIGVLCHETKQFDEALDMYKLALEALDDEANQDEKATLDNVGIEGGRIRRSENSIFFDYVHTQFRLNVPPPPETEEETPLLSQLEICDSYGQDASSLPVRVGDHVRIGDSFETELLEIIVPPEDQKESTLLAIKIKDQFKRKKRPVKAATEDEEEEEEDNKTKNEETTTMAFFVKRENKRLENPPVTSIAFNLARLHEAVGRTLAAVELHKAIVKRNPAYVNSYLRLACIAIDCGCLKECSEWLKIAASVAPGNPEVLTLVGNLHLSLCDWKPAQDVFDQLLAKKVPNVEAYAMLSLGNIYFENMKVYPPRYLKHLQYATDYYRRILAKDPANAYAANGMGTVLAEKAEIFKAKEIFNRVREVSGDNIPDAHLNLGHIFLAQKKHPEALQMYQSYMKRTEDGTAPITSKSRADDVVDVLNYIAFAYFDWARQTEQFNNEKAAPADGRYKQAMEHLELALTKKTNREVLLRYNLCMTKLQAANCVMQKLTRNIRRTAREMEQASQDLKDSHQAVSQILRDKTEGKKVAISTSTLRDFLGMCEDHIEHAKSHLENDRKKEQEANEMREMQRVAAELQMKEQALQQEMEKMNEAKLQEERDRKAREKMRKLEMLQVGWQHAMETQKISADKKKARAPPAPDVYDNDIVEKTYDAEGVFSDEDSEDEGTKQPGPKEHPTADKPMSETNEDDEKVEATTREELFGDSDEGDSDEDLLAGTKRANDSATNDDPPPKKARTAFEESDDDDD